jgi:uncharacterized cupin superfamily protein
MDLIWTVRSDTTGGGFSQFLQIAPPDSGVPLHVHLQDDESVYLLEGELVCRLGGRHVDLSRG